MVRAACKGSKGRLLDLVVLVEMGWGGGVKAYRVPAQCIERLCQGSQESHSRV